MAINDFKLKNIITDTFKLTSIMTPLVSAVGLEKYCKVNNKIMIDGIRSIEFYHSCMMMFQIPGLSKFPTG